MPCRFEDHPTVPVTSVHSLVAIARNRWSRSIGTPGRNQLEQVVAITRCAQAARQDDRRISGCMRFVIQIFDDADLAFRVFGAELRTVLSTTTVLADKPLRLSGRAIAQRFSAISIG